MFEFFSEALRNLRHTGSLWPSSPILARTMTESISRIEGKRRVLEVGPGTGPFTKAILRKLRAGDQFDLVEINEKFCRLLEREVLGPYRARHPNVIVRLHCAPIEDAPLSGPYDVIVCGLPFNNFPPKLMRSIFRRMFALLAPRGEVVYFEYAGVRVIKGPVSNSAGRAQLKRIDTIGKTLRRKHEGKTKLVLGNFPPAIAYRLKAAKSETKTAAKTAAKRA
ncbi:MAG: methyltransferase domain-containing protein [Planctomycetota bacterium]|nr:MAG: methyltransferase domain-containing protein [Planctomycetota bacterium]RLS96275.1 MAG: methyltransferase domain-containing protein [Planctomycetota bacterium]